MHQTSYFKMEAFRDAYLKVGEGLPRRVVDLGAAVHMGQQSYKDLFPSPQFEYVGVDMAEGVNVDIVLSHPHRWSEIATGSVDVVVSGQMLEHDSYFWVTVCEIGRILRPGGWCCIVAPSRGPAHFFPRDCWRFYPDAGASMMTFAGLDVVETYVEPGTFRRKSGVEWGDMMVIARLSDMDDAQHKTHLGRLAQVVASVPDLPIPDRETLMGPAISLYERNVRRSVLSWRPYLLRKGWAHLKMRVWNSVSPRLRERLNSLR